MASNATTPAEDARNDSPLCRLRVQILSARGLAAKDRNGKSDPFVVLSLPGTAEHSYQTPVKPKTLDPVWRDKEATFEYNVVPDWFGPHFAALATEEINPDVVKALLGHDVASNASAAAGMQVVATSSKTGRPRLMLASSSAKKIGGAATKILVAPVKFGAAGAKAVGRGMPRPMMMKRRISGIGTPGRTSAGAGAGAEALVSAANLLAGKPPPRGSIQFDATSGIVSTLEFVLWDKDKFSGNDYMGECSLLVREWCATGEADWNTAKPFWVPVVSSRPDTKTSGEIQVKIGLVEAPKRGGAAGSDTAALGRDPTSQGKLPGWSLNEVYQRLALASLGCEDRGVRAVPASQSVGTAGPTEDFLDDGLSSGSELDDDEEDEEDRSSVSSASTLDNDDDDDDDEFLSETEDDQMYDEHYKSIVEVPSEAASAQLPSASQPSTLVPAAVPQQQQQPGRYRRIFQRRKGVDTSKASSGASTPSLGGFPGAGLTLTGEQSLDGTGSSSAGLESSADSSEKRRRRLPGVKGVKRVGRRRHDLATTVDPDSVEAARSRKGRARRRVRARRSRQEYSFKAEMGTDIIGIVMMEVKEASDLPRWKNMTQLTFDMDPFTIVSFGQKVFRTKVARHTLNPVWNEKLLFHVRRHETNFQAKFMIYDWDKISSNDYVGGASIEVAELIEAAPKPDPETGLYDPDEDGLHSMKEFRLSLSRLEKDEEVKFKGNKQAPSLRIEAKFTPYEALRQRFWRQLALQYDTNDSGALSRLELSSMLDSLGSTLSTQTLNGFFQANGKNPEDDELTFGQVIKALEDEIKKPWAQKRRASVAGLESGAQTPGGLGYVSQIGSELNGDLDMSGSNAPVVGSEAIGRDGYFHKQADDHRAPVPPQAQSAVGGVASEPTNKLIPGAAPPRSLQRDLSALSLGSASSPSSSSPGRSLNADDVDPTAGVTQPRQASSNSIDGSTASPSLSPSSSPPQQPLLAVEGNVISETDTHSVERVIRLKSCPLCHMPRLSKKGEVDIVTHLAVCASQDWKRVDSLVVANFVTASQAHRKWYTKMVNKISQGNYSLGANSANIIVQDRLSGELMEEKMQVYVRLGIRLLYKGARSRMEGARVKRMLKNMSVKQGVKFDSPASARDIAPFIAFHNLNLDEILDPLDSFKTFNEFFYRKLKPDARPNSEPDNARRLVSGADCRMMAFKSVQDATRIWIKGRDFTVARLLGDAAKRSASIESYENGGSVAIFRLAPQDYHRFHCPADATVGECTWIEGQYYTVNPMAIRSAIDVYGENIRVVVPFHSDEFGTFYAVCIGAMMVGSTVLTVKEGERVRRGQEFGYFKFGGSTIVLVFESGRMVFDDDILDNSKAAIETLVRVGMGIGRAVE